jgi:putative copper export protein
LLVDALSATLRALSFVALFQAAGVAIFIAIFGRQLMRTRVPLRRIGSASAISAIVLVAAHYALEAARMSGELAGVMDSSLQALVLHSSASAALVLRLLGLALILFGLVGQSMSRTLTGLAGAALALVAFVFVGHTTTHSPRALLATLLFCHLAVAAFWFGALLPLLAISAREPAALATLIVERFSRLASWLVPGLFLAGALLATLLLPNIEALGSDYGQLLVAKIAGFGTLMALAGLNKWRFGPALANGATRAFQRAVVAEYVIVLAIFGVTAAMTSFYSPE